LNPLKPNTGRTCLAHDVLASAVCWVLAFWLRLNLEYPRIFRACHGRDGVGSLARLDILSLACTGQLALREPADLKRIALACMVGALAVPALLAFFRADINVRGPLSSSRPSARRDHVGQPDRLCAWKERSLYGNIHLTGNRTRDRYRRHHGQSAAGVGALEPVGAVGILDDTGLARTVLLGVKVLGGLGEVGRWADQLDSHMRSSRCRIRRRACAGAQRISPPLRLTSSPCLLTTTCCRQSHVSQIRRIELEDLLGRDQVVLDARLHQLLTASRDGHGAGGSIGSELARQVARIRAGRDSSCSTRTSTPVLHRAGIPVGPQKAGHRTHNRRRAQSGTRPGGFLQIQTGGRVPPPLPTSTLPLMEIDNTWKRRRTTSSDAAPGARRTDHGVEKFVLVSTDKAVNPTNVMARPSACRASLPGAAACQRTRFSWSASETCSPAPERHSQVPRSRSLAADL